ncbi:hypothetical protein ACWDQO_32075 [Streptomyces sp. NPDC003703]|uniref:hypothetical protein n=1 Tax=Streptomyces sp. NPDC003283 TaxID=3364681 RepID=UPI0036AC9A41
MSPTLRRLIGVTAAAVTGAATLLVAGAGTAGAAERAHCDRAEQNLWSDGPSRGLTAYHCDIPSGRGRWYTVEIDTLVQTHRKGDTLDGAVDRTRTLHDRTFRCLGYTSEDGTVNWFGCPPS